MVSCNIPLNNCDKTIFKNFFEFANNRKIHSSTHYQQNIVPKLADQLQLHVIDRLKEPFYLMLDESPDRMERKLLNILIGNLSDTKAVKA